MSGRFSRLTQRRSQEFVLEGGALLRPEGQKFDAECREGFLGAAPSGILGEWASG